MIITDFEEKTTTLNKPPSMTDEECLPLPVFKNDEMVISCWKFTDKELLIAMLERKIWLRVWGEKFPPVHLSPEHPFVSRDITPDDIDIVIERLIQRKAVQFLTRELDKIAERTETASTDAYEIDLLSSEFIKNKLKDFAKFLVSTAPE